MANHAMGSLGAYSRQIPRDLRRGESVLGRRLPTGRQVRSREPADTAAGGQLIPKPRLCSVFRFVARTGSSLASQSSGGELCQPQPGSSSSCSRSSSSVAAAITSPGADHRSIPGQDQPQRRASPRMRRASSSPARRICAPRERPLPCSIAAHVELARPSHDLHPARTHRRLRPGFECKPTRRRGSGCAGRCVRPRRVRRRRTGRCTR